MPGLEPGTARGTISDRMNGKIDEAGTPKNKVVEAMIKRGDGSKKLATKDVLQDAEEKSQHNSRGRGRSEAEKRASYDKYRKNKLIALDAERRNKQYLVLYPASDVDTNKNRFYNMGGNSAIIYVHEIAPRLKRKAKLRRDLDPCKESERFHSGICSIMDMAGLEERLKSIGVEKVDMKGELVYFKLAREYPRDEIRGMLRVEQEKLNNLNKLLYSEVLLPKMHNNILELKRVIPIKVKNMHKSYRDVIGMEIIKVLMEMVRIYTYMTHGDLSAREALPKIVRECDMMLATISIMNELRVWEVDACVKAGETVVGVRQMAKEELAKIEAKKG